MTGRRFNGLFESLEASFDAAEARAERDAADDLALSLRQDRTAFDVLSRGGWRIERIGATSTRLLALGRDYAATASGDLLPLGNVIARASRSVPPPELREDSLRERLRKWAREGQRIELSTPGKAISGRLLSAGRDHVIVETRGGLVVLAYAVLERVSQLRGSSADAL